jgi:glutathione S-transferase
MSITLFGLTRSVYTRIVRMVLAEKDVAYTLEEVEIFSAQGVPPMHLARHPFGRIPVLKHGEFSLFETSAITRYIDEAFVGSTLQPTEAIQRARLNQVIGLLDAYAYRPLVWGVFVQRVRLPLQGVPTDEGEVTCALASAHTVLSVLETLIGAQPFLIGASPTLADFHAYPMFRYFSLAPEGLTMLRDHFALQRWFDRMQRRDSATRTLTPYETTKVA